MYIKSEGFLLFSLEKLVYSSDDSEKSIVIYLIFIFNSNSKE